MREQEFRARDKKVQKMTKDGLVEENRTRQTTARISGREADTAFRGKETPDGEDGEISEDLRGAMRDAGDKPVIKSRAGRKEERESRGEKAGTHREERLTSAGKKNRNRTRLRYMPEELPPGAVQAQRDNMHYGDTKHDDTRREDGQRIGEKRRYQRDVHREKENRAQERADMPSRLRIPEEKQDSREKRKRAGRLRFERQERKEQSVRGRSGAAGRLFAEAERISGSREAEEAQEENLGVEAAHKTERIVGAGIRKASGKRGMRMRENPYSTIEHRTVNRTERRLQKAGAGVEYRRSVQDDRKLQKRAYAKWMQKRRIRQKYATAARESARESAKGAAHTANVLNKSGQVIRAAAKAVPKKTVLGLVAAVVLLAAMSGALFTSCGSMLAGIQSAIIATCYVADEEAINQSDLYYSEMETDLQLSINKTEEDYPGYDEYVYNVGEISHNPYELLGYLSAVYDAFSVVQVEAELEPLFGL